MLRIARRALGAVALAWLLTLGAAAPAAAADAPASAALDVNSATADQLMALPGIGETKARAIVEAREARGGFRSVEELVEVKGIGPAALERIRPHVTVKGRAR